MKTEEKETVMPFEVFFLGELLAEGIIDQDLFNATLPQLKEKKKVKQEEMEEER